MGLFCIAIHATGNGHRRIPGMGGCKLERTVQRRHRLSLSRPRSSRPTEAGWRLYEPVEFHEMTLRANDLHIGKALA
jgi:hypothetical protein